MKGKLTKVTNILLNIMFIGGIVTVLTLPGILKLGGTYRGGSFSEHYLAMVLVFVIAGLFSRVLAQVFDRAVTYKQENDLTI